MVLYDYGGGTGTPLYTVWNAWSTASTSSCADTWTEWVEADVTTANCAGATTGLRVWLRWSTSTNYSTVPAAVQVIEAPKLSQEEQERLEADREAIRAARVKAEAERQAAAKLADERAAQLLEQHLDEPQRQQFRKRKPIRVIAGDGAAFELGHSWAGNARELDKDGQPVASYCIHAREHIPLPDHLLSQKLLLEADPAAFRRIANRTNLGRPVEV